MADGVTIAADKRHEGRLEGGIDIPTLAEISKILAPQHQAANRALLVTAVFTGLRSRERRDCGGRTRTSPRESCMFASVPRYNTKGRPRWLSRTRKTRYAKGN